MFIEDAGMGCEDVSSGAARLEFRLAGEERIAEFLSEQADIMSIYDFVKRGAHA